MVTRAIMPIRRVPNPDAPSLLPRVKPNHPHTAAEERDFSLHSSRAPKRETPPAPPTPVEEKGEENPADHKGVGEEGSPFPALRQRAWREGAVCTQKHFREEKNNRHAHVVG